MRIVTDTRIARSNPDSNRHHVTDIALDDVELVPIATPPAPPRRRIKPHAIDNQSSTFSIPKPANTAETPASVQGADMLAAVQAAAQKRKPMLESQQSSPKPSIEPRAQKMSNTAARSGMIDAYYRSSSQFILLRATS